MWNSSPVETRHAIATSTPLRWYFLASWVIVLGGAVWLAWYESPITFSIWRPIGATVSAIPISWVFGYKRGICLLLAMHAIQKERG